MSGGDTYKCHKCTQTFRDAYNFKRHMDRKTPCTLILEAEDRPIQACDALEFEQKICRFCGRAFSSPSAMRRHVRSWCRVAPNTKNGDKGMERLYEHTLQRQNAEQNAKIDRLEAQVKAQNEKILLLLARQGAPSSSSTLQAGEVGIQGDQNQVDNSKKIININVFGQEKLDHVTVERIKAILDECLQRPALPTAISEAVLKTAMLVYSDPDRPENLTAYLPNKKTKDALVHTKAGWEVQPTQLILPPMALKSIDTIFGKQPHSDEYAPLLKELQQNEARFAAGEDLHPILVRNKELLARALATLPVAGE